MLVRDAKKAWRWWSVQAMALAGAIQGAWLFVPDDLKARVPDDLASTVTAVLMVLGIVGRLVPQGSE
jgi:hypothetical protein